MVQLLAKFAFVDQFRQPNGIGTIDETEGHSRFGTVSKDRLTHEKLVKIGVDQRPHNGIDLPLVVPDACRNVDHGKDSQLPGCCARSIRSLSRSPEVFFGFHRYLPEFVPE